MTLNDAQEAARLAPMDDNDNDEDAKNVDGDYYKEKPDEEMAWNSHYLQGGDHRGLPHFTDYPRIVYEVPYEVAGDVDCCIKYD